MNRFSLLAVTLVVVVSTPVARGQDTEETKRLKERIELLETKLKLSERDILDLKARVAELEKGTGKKGGDAAKKDPFEVGTKWKGKATIGTTDNNTKSTAELTVIERSEKTAKISVSYENGAVWVYECSTKGESLEIKSAVREKVATVNEGKKDLLPVGATTGKVVVADNKITLTFKVPGGMGQGGWGGTVIAEREK